MSLPLGLVACVVALLFWEAVGYPVFLCFVGAVRRRHRPPARGTEPTLSVVVPARDEEREIAAKISDVLAQEAPGLVEVLVVSDASRDETEARARSVGDPRVRVLRLEGRRGKTACHRLGLSRARGEVVVLTDCGCRLAPGALRALAGAFEQPGVGCAGGRVVYHGTGGGGGGSTPLERAWRWIWRAEDLLWRLESRAAGLTGVSGILCAVRREGSPVVPEDLLDDWTLAALTAAAGLRTVYVPAAVAFEAPASRLREDARRRVRIAAQTLATLRATLPLWASPSRPLFAVQVFSHKVLRYLTPWLLLALAPLGAWGELQAGSPAVRAAWIGLLLLAGAVLAAGGAGLWLGVRGRRTVLWPLGYGLYLQAVLLAGWWRWARGEAVRGWAPERSGSPTRSGEGPATAAAGPRGGGGS